jgi:hypothetical protein
MDFVKLICAFIDPGSAKKMFDENERNYVENSGFEDDIIAISPNADLQKINEILSSME